MSPTNECDIKLNMRREIPYLLAATYYFFTNYKHTNDDFFDDFPKISRHFQKISENSPKVVRRPDKRFRKFSEHFKRLSKISEEDAMVFRSYSGTSKYSLRDYATIPMVIFSIVKTTC